jgi:mRNA degradation ribonuclease J1/J2
MAKNLGRKFATMSEDERRRFALEEEEGTSDHPAELAFDEPRKAENMGPQFSSMREEVADPEHRDGMSALLDDEQHNRAVRDASAPNDHPVEDSE